MATGNGVFHAQASMSNEHITRIMRLSGILDRLSADMLYGGVHENEAPHRECLCPICIDLRYEAIFFVPARDFFSQTRVLDTKVIFPSFWINRTGFPLQWNPSFTVMENWFLNGSIPQPVRNRFWYEIGCNPSSYAYLQREHRRKYGRHAGQHRVNPGDYAPYNQGDLCFVDDMETYSPQSFPSYLELGFAPWHTWEDEFPKLCPGISTIYSTCPSPKRAVKLFEYLQDYVEQSGKSRKLTRAEKKRIDKAVKEQIQIEEPFSNPPNLTWADFPPLGTGKVSSLDGKNAFQSQGGRPTVQKVSEADTSTKQPVSIIETPLEEKSGEDGVTTPSIIQVDLKQVPTDDPLSVSSVDNSGVTPQESPELQNLTPVFEVKQNVLLPFESDAPLSLPFAVNPSGGTTYIGNVNATNVSFAQAVSDIPDLSSNLEPGELEEFEKTYQGPKQMYGETPAAFLTRQLKERAGALDRFITKKRTMNHDTQKIVRTNVRRVHPTLNRVNPGAPLQRQRDSTAVVRLAFRNLMLRDVPLYEKLSSPLIERLEETQMSELMDEFFNSSDIDMLMPIIIDHTETLQNFKLYDACLGHVYELKNISSPSEPEVECHEKSWLQHLVNEGISILKNSLSCVCDLGSQFFSMISEYAVTFFSYIKDKVTEQIARLTGNFIWNTYFAQLKKWVLTLVGGLAAFVAFYYYGKQEIAYVIIALTLGVGVLTYKEAYTEQNDTLRDVGFLGGLILLGQAVAYGMNKNISSVSMVTAATKISSGLGAASKLRQGAVACLGIFPEAFQQWVHYFIVSEDSLIKWRVRAQAIILQYNTRKLSLVYGVRAAGYLAEAQALLTEFATFTSGKTASDSQYVSTLNTIVSTLSVRIKYISEHPPFYLALYGVPGIGKTTMVKTFVDSLVRDNILSCHVGDNTVYNAPTTEEFCSGYVGQPAWLFDDPDALLEGSLFFKLVLRMKNRGLCYLPQASLSDPMTGQKGDINVSPLMISTSNTAHQSHITAITYAQANPFLRRRDWLVKIICDENVMVDGNVDCALQMELFPGRPFGHLTFQQVSQIKGNEECEVGPLMTYEEFYEEFCNVYAQYHCNLDKMLTKMEGYVNQGLTLVRLPNGKHEVKRTEELDEGDELVHPPAESYSARCSRSDYHCGCLQSDSEHCEHHKRCDECKLRISRHLLATTENSTFDVLRVVLGACAALSMAYGAYKVYENVMKPCEPGVCYIDDLEQDREDLALRENLDVLEDQKSKKGPRISGKSGGPDSSQKRDLKRYQRSEIVKGKVTDQAGRDQLDVVADMIVEAKIINQSSSVVMEGNIVIPGGPQVLFPRHYLNFVEAEPNDTLLLEAVVPRVGPISQVFKMHQCETFSYGEKGVLSDVIKLRISCNFSPQQHFKMFADENDLMKTRDNVILITKRNGIIHRIPLQKVEYYTKFTRRDMAVSDKFAAPGFVYLAQTVNGDCGGLVYDIKESKILAMHVGRYDIVGRGKGIHIDRRMFNQHFPVREEDTDGYNPQGGLITFGERGSFMLPENIVRIGRVDRDHSYSGPDQSRLHPTIFYDVNGNYPWGCPTKFPAILSRHDHRANGRNPMYEGLAESGNRHGLDLDLVYQVENWLTNDFERMTEQVNVDVRVYTLDEAINGVPGAIDRLDQTTSEGYFWALLRPPHATNKSWMFGSNAEGRTVITHQPLIDRIIDRIEKAKQWIIVRDSMYVKILKDEKLKQSKIDSCRTRIFDAGPVDLLLCFRMFFGAWQSMMEKSATYFMHAIGVDCASPTWDLVMQRLKDDYPSLFDGDMVGWDLKLLGALQESVINSINNWYQRNDKQWEPWHNIVRRVLYEENINTWALVFAEVILMNVGVPSGNFLTASGNTCLNRALVMAWVITILGDITYDEFLEIIRQLSMGDDHVVRVHKDYQDVLNGASFRDFLKALGMDYTPADKMSTDFPFRMIDEIEFVKMNNKILRNGNIVAVPMRVSFDNGLQYLEAPPSKQDILLDNLVGGFCYQIFWHGETMYNSYRDAMIGIADSKNVRLTVPTYREMYVRYLRKFGDLGDYAPACHKPQVLEGMVYAGEFVYECQPKARRLSGHSRELEVNCDLVDQAKAVAEAEEEVRNKMSDLVDGSEAADKASNIPSNVSKPYRPEPEFRVSDVAWSYSKQVAKYFYFATFTFSTTSTAGEILGIWDNPLGLIGNCLQKAAFNSFKYWRGNTSIKIIVNKTQFHSGALVFWWAPLVDAGLTDSGPQIPGRNLTRATGMRSLVVDIQSEVSEQVFEFPFAYFLSAMPTDLQRISTESATGTFGVSVLSPLRAGSGTTASIEINIHTSFPNSVFMVPRPVDVCPTGPPQNITGRTKNRKVAKEGYTQQGGSVSKKTEITNVYYGDNNSTGQELGGDEYDQGTEISPALQTGGADLDRLAVNTLPIPVELNTHSSMNKVNQPIAADPFGPSLKEQPIMRSKIFGVQEDEMDFKTLLSKWVYGGSVPWNTTATKGTVLSFQPITIMPSSSIWRTGDVNQAVTYMDFIANVHQWWKGPIEVMIHVIGSGVVSGSLQLSTNYGGFAQPASLTEAATQYYSVFTLDSSSRRWHIKFTNPIIYPYLKTEGSLFSQMSEEEKRENFPGTFSVMVQNKLIVGSGAPSTVDLLFFYRAPEARFFQKKRALFVPTFNPFPPGDFDILNDDLPRNKAPKKKETVRERVMVIEGGYTEQAAPAAKISLTKTSQPTMQVLGKDSDIESTMMPNLYEYTSFRAHVKQFYSLGYPTLAPGIEGNLATEESIYVSFLGYFISLYAVWRGTYMLKFFPDDPEAVIEVRYDASDKLVNNMFTILGDNTFKGIVYAGAPAKVMQVPFSSQYKFLFCNQTAFNVNDPDYTSAGTVYFISNKATGVKPFVSGGDEFRAGCLIGPPTVSYYPIPNP
jgi:hypothetical protein